MDAELQSSYDVLGQLRTQKTSRMQFWLGILVVIAAVFLSLTTYLILTGQTRVIPNDVTVFVLLGSNVALVVAMIGMIVWQLVSIMRGRERGIAGARLHLRLITMFGIVAALPAVLVAVFASVTLDRGLDSWFSVRTRAIIDNAQTVAEAYLLEHGQVLRSDAAAMRNDINRAHSVYLEDKERFAQLFKSQALVRSLSAAYIIYGNGNLILRTVSLTDDEKYLKPPKLSFEKAQEDRIVLFSPGIDNMVRALTKLPAFEDTYLFLYRAVDPRVVQHLLEIKSSRAEYDELENRRANVQITFALLYIGMTLIFLLAAIWSGIWVANKLVRPIGLLIIAARQVSNGDLSASVDIAPNEGDLASLGQTFNNMTERLRNQHNELTSANLQLDSRRLFTEAVLSGVSSGVIGLNQKGIVELQNRSASILLGLQENEIFSKELAKVVPEFSHSIKEAIDRYPRGIDAEIKLLRNSNEQHLHLRVTSEQTKGDNRRYVVTFDDVTQLVNAQRSSAWSDIARRIAHEIKNPLTPIQLSAERLKRKYTHQITEDQDIFEQCTDTIIRQVGDIGKMVDEFSSFARMPKANMESRNIYDIIRESVVLQRVGRPELDFTCTVPREPLFISCDRRLIGQALTNLVKNASEAIEAVAIKDDPNWRGKIYINATYNNDEITIEVIDNGCGFPKEDRQRLTEPYMTTREKGTGLGLAIVRKIIDEHGGSISLEDAPSMTKEGHGALVKLVLPVREKNNAGNSLASDKPAKDNLESTEHGV